MKKIKHSISPTKIKTIILSIAIALVLTLFVVYLIQAIYPKPEWNNFCEEKALRIPAPENKELLGGTCATVSPDYRDECCKNKGYKYYNEESGECEGNYYSECQEQYENSLNKYKLIVFIVSVIVGLIAVSTGIILHLPSVSSGLMLGGTFLVFYGTVVYWSNLNNILRSLILGISLIILIWLGYRKLQN